MHRAADKHSAGDQQEKYETNWHMDLSDKLYGAHLHQVIRGLRQELKSQVVVFTLPRHCVRLSGLLHDCKFNVQFERTHADGPW